MDEIEDLLTQAPLRAASPELDARVEASLEAARPARPPRRSWRGLLASRVRVPAVVLAGLVLLLALTSALAVRRPGAPQPAPESIPTANAALLPAPIRSQSLEGFRPVKRITIRVVGEEGTP